MALPTETDKMQEFDVSTNLGPPKSFVAWSEPEKLETQEKCTEQEKNVKNISEEAENQCDEGCDKETLSSTNSCDQGLVKKGAATCDIRDQPQDPPTNSPDRCPYIFVTLEISPKIHLQILQTDVHIFPYRHC